MPVTLFEKKIGITSEIDEGEKLNRTFLLLNRKREKVGLKPLKYSIKKKNLVALYEEGYEAVSQIEKRDRLTFWRALPGGARYIETHQIHKYSPRKVEHLLRNWLQVFGLGIEELTLKGVNLKFLPPEITLLKDLQKLSLYDNPFVA